MSSASPDVSRPSTGRTAAALAVVGVAALLGGALLVGKWASDGDSETVAVRPGIEVPVTAANQTVQPGNNSPTVVADPGDSSFVALANRLDAPDFGCALHVSGDGGRNWAPVNPLPTLPQGAEKCYAPEVAFDRNGVLYYLFVGLHTRGNLPMGVFITSSADRGRTFTPPVQVLGPLNFAVRMAINPDRGKAGRIHLVWIKATADPPLGGFPPPPNPILAAHSDDGGRTFSEPVQVNDPERLRVVAPALVLGPDRRVHVAYYDLGEDVIDYQGLEGAVWEGEWSLVLATSGDGGASFGPGRVVDDSVVPPERVMLIFTMAPPALAVRGDRLCMAWTDARHGDPDVFARCSEDAGRSWRPAKRVNDDQLSNGLSQFMPRLALSDDGRLDAIFYDRRPESHNIYNYVFFSTSSDGGRQWARNVRLTQHASSSRVGQQYANVSARGQVEFGSRLGLLSGPRAALAAWADTRNSGPISTSQDVFSTVVSISGGGGRSSWEVAGGGVLAVVGGLMLFGAWRLRPRTRPAGPAGPADEAEEPVAMASGSQVSAESDAPSETDKMPGPEGDGEGERDGGTSAQA